MCRQYGSGVSGWRRRGQRCCKNARGRRARARASFLRHRHGSRFKPHGMKVNIVDWHGVATWHWRLGAEEGVDEVCGICRVPFDGTCPNCKYPGDECPLVLGRGCTHNFHLHCILKWLEQEASKGLCPMCRQVFVHVADGQTSAEFESLQHLEEGHKLLRERERDYE